MTFLEIQQDTYRRLNKATSPDTATTTRIKAFINQRHRTLMSEPGMDQLRNATTTFASVAATARVALAQTITRVNAIYQTTENRRLGERDLDWLRSVDPQQTSGTPTVYVPLGYEYAAKQPSNASQVWVKSTSASDVGTLRIEGVRTGGYPASASVTLTGTTAVQVGTFSDWTQIDKVFSSAAAVGAITVHEDSGTGTELAQIRIGAYRPYYFVILLWPTPAGVLTYSVDYTREITDMAQDTDEPLLPTDFHDLLSMGARLDEYEKTDDKRFTVAASEWQRKFVMLQYWLHGRASARKIPRAMSGRVGISDLGGNYPADIFIP